MVGPWFRRRYAVDRSTLLNMCNIGGGFIDDFHNVDSPKALFEAYSIKHRLTR
jgi:hypothetical protein